MCPPCDKDMTTGTTDSYIDSQYMFPPCDIDMTTGTTDSYIDSQYIYVSL